MRIDPSASVYHPLPDVRKEFSPEEIERCEVLLRRLRFLEHQVNANGGMAGGSGGSGWAVWESRALAWILKDVGYLPEDDREA